MSVSQNRSSVTRLAGKALFVSGCLPSDAACTNEVSASQAGGSVKELVFSFFDCTPVPQGPHFTVLSDLSDQSDLSDYSVITEAARDFPGWITVTAYAVIRSVVRAFRRIVSEANALFNRRIHILQGGLRL